MLSRLFIGVVLFKSILPGLAFGQEPDRRNGIEHFDRWVTIVRGSMNNSPDAVQQFLTYGLARDVGDDPRVISLCAEVIVKNTNPTSIVNAVGAVGIVEGWYTPLYAIGRRKKIGAVLADAMTRPEWAIKLDASKILDDMGGSYRKAARQFYLKTLSNPPDDKTFGQIDRKWPGSTKALLVEIIRRLLVHWNPSDAAVVRKVTDEYQLLDYAEREAAKINQPAWQQTEKAFIGKWRAAVRTK